MKNLFLRLQFLWMVGMWLITASQVGAFMSPAAPELPNFDKRDRERPFTANVSQRNAVASLKAQLPDARVHFDERIGTPRWIVAERGFLTGPDGQGKGVGAAAARVVGAGDEHRATKAFLTQHQTLFGFGPEILTQARVKSSAVTAHNGLRTVVWEQSLDGITIFEGLFISHTTKNGELVNLSSHFIPNPGRAADAGVPGRSTAIRNPSISARRAVALAATNLGDALDESDVAESSAEPGSVELRQQFAASALAGSADVRLVWLPMSLDAMRLCWEVVLTSRTRSEMYRLLVDAESGEVQVRHRLTEYLSDATYRVFTSDSPSPFSPGHATPMTNQPPVVARSLVTLSALDTNASPAGWINDGGNETLGNNVDAHTDRDGNNIADLPRPQGSPARTFDFTLDLAQAPAAYTNAAVTDLFYWCNWVHDRLYSLGFDEAGRNFQTDNFGRGGLGNDALQADAQDGSGSNNANMSTPSDGSPPRMQMYVFTGPNPDRDGDLDHEIVIHEYVHGLSNRRVGGGVGLSASQSRGMGEGWSDWYALTLLSEPGDDVNGAYAKGGYATYLFGGLLTNYYFGIRRYPYCTDISKNPLTFKDIDPVQASAHAGIPRNPVIGTTANEVHNQGEVWCMALWEARAKLITKHGHAAGNDLALRLVTDGMNLSPANPNFLQARDAILQADSVNTGGANWPELWSAFARRGMGVSAYSPASSTTTGLIEAYDVPDHLSVMPVSDLSFNGPVGGPFTPGVAGFVLFNSGSTNLNWSLSSTSLWFSAFPTSGILTAGLSTTVSVTVISVANSLPAGSHSALVRFTNVTSGNVQSRTVRFDTVGSGMMDDFDPGIDLSQWSSFGGTVGSTVLATNYGGYVSSPNSLWFGDSGSRYATTIPINTIAGGSLSFALRLGSGSSPWETLDLPGEAIVLEASTNNGSTWILLNTYNSTAYQSWTTITSSIPAAARSPATQFRWRQLTHSGSGYDHWAIDNALIDATPPTILTLNLPASASEGDAPVAAMVTASPAPTNDLTVSLDSLDPSEVTVPASVVILGGQSNATFNVSVENDADLDGTQVAHVSASATGYLGDSAVILVHDDETATLTVALPATAMEGDAPVQATVAASAVPVANIEVDLVSSDPSEIQVPASVLIPAGQTSAVFSVTVMNDLLIDGDQLAAVTAQVTNWTSGQAEIIIHDNEPTNLVVSLPPSAREGDGVLTGAGMVQVGGLTVSNLVVSLSSGDATELEVPPSVVITAGKSFAAFDLTIVDDPDVDGSQSVTVLAGAPGFSNGSTNMTVTDDESPFAPFSPAPAHLATNVIQTTDLSWSSGAVPGEVITNDVYFGTNPTPGPSELLGTTTNTSWTLPTLVPLTTYYWRVIAKKTGVTPGPVWQFTTRGVDHFSWEPIPSPQYVGEPFAIAVAAKDEFGTTVSNFTGVAALSARTSGESISDTILGNTTNASASTGSYLYTLGYSFTPATNITVTHLRSFFGTKVTLWTDSGTLIVSQPVSGPVGVWTETELPAPVTLSAGTTYRVGAYTGGTLYYWQNSGPTTFPAGTLNQGYYTSVDGFPTSTTTAIRWMVDLRYTVGTSSSMPLSLTNTGPFVNGRWAGNVTALAPSTNLVLVAADGQGHDGESSPFEVGLRNDIAVSLAGSPSAIGTGGNVTYLIQVTNVGPGNANSVMLTNIMPSAAALVSVNTSQGSSGNVSNLVVCNLHSLQANNSATIEIVAAITNAGTFTNLVTVSRSDTDAYLGNNTAQTVTTVMNPVVSISDVVLSEGNAGITNANFNVSITPAPAATAYVNFATSDGTAVAPADFISTNGTLAFTPGQTNRILSVPVLGELAYESNEQFVVNLTAAIHADLADAQGVCTILNDDSMPMLSIGDVAVTEGNSGTTEAVFPVSLTVASGFNTSFYYNTVNGSAVAGTDYQGRNGSLTIPAGVSTTNITIAVNGELHIESDEVFYLDLSSVANAILLKREGYGLILNDDGLPGELDHFAWGPITPTQHVGQAFPVAITALDVFDNPAVNYAGPAQLSAFEGPALTNVVGTSSSTVSFPIYTAAYAERTQVIYPAAQLGGAGPIKALALDVAATPGMVLSNWTIRMKPAALSNYTSYVWETSDWTVVCQTNISVTSTGWVTFPFAAPFDYDGTNSLMVDFSFYNSSYSAAGACRSTYQGATRTLYSYTSGYGNPLTWSNSIPSPSGNSYTPNLRLFRGGEAVAIVSEHTGAFTNGVWAGSVTVLSPSTNLVLHVEDEDGRGANSGSIAVVPYDDVSLLVEDSPNPVAVGADLVYTAVISNSGPSVANGVVVTNTLPSGATLGSVTPSQGVFTSLGQTVICNLGTINVGAIATVTTIVVPNQVGVATNTAVVTRSGPDGYAGNNRVTNLTSVQIPALALGDASILESTTGMVFSVSLSVVSPQTVSVNFATTNGTAIAGSDYSATNGVLTFMPGETNRIIEVRILDDSVHETIESFSVLLWGAVNADIDKGEGIGSIVDNEGPPDFQILNLLASNSKVVDHNALTGDDRGGVAISTGQVFVTGDSATARFNAGDLTGGASLGIIRDSLCTDLATETVYLLGNGTTPLTSSGGTVTTLIELAATTGLPTGATIPLSQSFTMASSGNGIFSGYGRVVVHTGGRAYDIHIPIGTVTDLGSMTRPSWNSSESWSVWGVAEAFGGSLYLAYRESGTQRIVRARIPDGQVTPVAVFTSLGDMASFVVSPSRSRWYFHHEGSSQFGGASETLGYADAELSVSSTNPPIILTQPINQVAVAGGAATFFVTAAGSSPIQYFWRRNGSPLVGATQSSCTVTNVQMANNGDQFSCLVSNNFGAVLSANATLSVLTGLTQVAVFDNPNFVDTAGTTASESDNVQASLTNKGFSVLAFTNLAAGLAGQELVLFPEQEISSLATALSASDRSMLSNFVAGGGLMIVHGSVGSRAASLLNTIFGFSLVESALTASGTSKQITAAADGTQFADDPTTLAWNNACSMLQTSSLPPGSRSIYEGSGQSLVAVMYVGSGEIVFLGWDWYDALPRGVQDAGWLTVLESAVLEHGSNQSQQPALHLLLGRMSGGGLQLSLATADGSPLTSNRAARIQVHSAMSPGGVAWNPMTNVMVLTNGVLHVEGLSTTNHWQEFFRAVELP